MISLSIVRTHWSKSGIFDKCQLSAVLLTASNYKSGLCQYLWLATVAVTVGWQYLVVITAFLKPTENQPVSKMQYLLGGYCPYSTQISPKPALLYECTATDWQIP